MDPDRLRTLEKRNPDPSEDILEETVLNFDTSQ